MFREPQTSSGVYHLEHTHEHDVEDERLQLWGGAYRFAGWALIACGRRAIVCVPPEAVHAIFGPATEPRPGSRRGSVSDGWLPIQ